jgi:hypothetical protein
MQLRDTNFIELLVPSLYHSRTFSSQPSILSLLNITGFHSASLLLWTTEKYVHVGSSPSCARHEDILARGSGEVVTPRKNAIVIGWATALVRTLRRREKPLPLAGNQTTMPRLSAHSLLTTPTELKHLSFTMTMSQIWTMQITCIRWRHSATECALTYAFSYINFPKFLLEFLSAFFIWNTWDIRFRNCRLVGYSIRTQSKAWILPQPSLE